MSKAYIKTYGCQMNEQDSSQMKSLLLDSGFEMTPDLFDADLVLINTCSIREKAVHKIYSDLGRVRPFKDENPNLIVGITGCVAEQEKSKLTDRFEFLDLVIGPDHIRKLPELIDEVQTKRLKTGKQPKVLKTGFDKRQDFEFVNILPQAEESPVKAFVNIQKGCDNICSFCIVPFVRGREVSRSHLQIIDEINALVDRGVKEVTLLGQNVNSYGLKNPGDVTFAELLELVAAKTNLKRLRFTTSHPKDVGDDLVEQFRHNPILAPNFHLPVQSGSNTVLKAMRRQYTREFYLETIAKLKDACPKITFSSDIIVGFPTETQSDFEETLSLIESVEYEMIFSFMYSPRPYTKAIELKDDVPQNIKSERLKVLQDLDRQIGQKINKRYEGEIHSILVEENDEENLINPLMGRTGTNKVVHFSGQAKAGDFVDVKITQANPYSLYGESI